MTIDDRLNSKSTPISDRDTLSKYWRDPEFPFLVSFPRTGSHWLRMMSELYFERPTLTRNFFYPEKSDFLFLHTHDMDLSVERRNVIYLYRQPVPTIFSQLTYHKDDTDDTAAIIRWTDIYGRHLEKWILIETFTVQKTVLRYDLLRDSMISEFSKLVRHFDKVPDPAKIYRAASLVTKQAVAAKVDSDDPQVIAKQADYGVRRIKFREKFSGLISDRIVTLNEKLAPVVEEVRA